MREGRIQRNPSVRAVTTVPTEHHDAVSRVDELLRHHLEVVDLTTDRLEDLFKDTLTTVMLAREGHAGQVRLRPYDAGIERFQHSRLVPTVERIVAATNNLDIFLGHLSLLSAGAVFLLQGAPSQVFVNRRN